MVRRYCETQEMEPEELNRILDKKHDEYKCDGFMLLRCVMMDSSRLGSRTILPFGGTSTYGEVPDGCISPRGLASDMSEVEAVYKWGQTLEELQHQ